MTDLNVLSEIALEIAIICHENQQNLQNLESKKEFASVLYFQTKSYIDQ